MKEWERYFSYTGKKASETNLSDWVTTENEELQWEVEDEVNKQGYIEGESL